MRVVVALWVLAVVPLLLFSLLMVVISAPRMVATAWDSVGVQADAVGAALGDGNWLRVIAGGLGAAAVALPVLGSAYLLVRLVRKAGSWAWSGARHVPLGRPAVALATIGIAGALAFTWWPNGEYRPIQPGERGTAADAFDAVEAVGTGRPGLTPELEAELEGAPSQSWNLSEGPTDPTPAEADDAGETPDEVEDAPSTATTLPDPDPDPDEVVDEDEPSSSPSTTAVQPTSEETIP